MPPLNHVFNWAFIINASVDMQSDGLHQVMNMLQKSKALGLGHSVEQFQF